MEAVWTNQGRLARLRAQVAIVIDQYQMEHSMGEHTPGPWEYDGGAQIVESARPHMRICFLPSDYHEYASSKPNARLIAAAPDLLEALKMARDCISYCRRAHKDAQSGEGVPVELFLDAAIAKATGAATTSAQQEEHQ
jgi:hypothetical protein